MQIHAAVVDSIRPVAWLDGRTSIGTPISDAVRTLLAADSALHDTAKQDLHGKVSAAVGRLRDEGVAPERVLVRVKSEVRAACALVRGAAESAELTDGIVSDAVQWSVAEYFRTR